MRMLEIVDRIIVIDNGTIVLDGPKRPNPRADARDAECRGMSARAIDDDHLFGGEGSVRLATATRLVWILAALFVAALGWAWFAALDEVATGEARVVPTSREQVIQSLEGGIPTKLPVRQDDIVTLGQLLAQLDPTQAGSTVDETAAKYRAALASVARLQSGGERHAADVRLRARPLSRVEGRRDAAPRHPATQPAIVDPADRPESGADRTRGPDRGIADRGRRGEQCRGVAAATPAGRARA
ncbi:hypothetical protein QP185_19045 [Sphingomonas aerolata]|uniref:hypothetical protein n=1 Tax=Sphingomonas aerolata TaxID=185951 RepID=UPI002FE0B741